MLVNPDKFQASVVKRNSNMHNQCTLDIDGNRVTSDKSVQLLSYSHRSQIIIRWACFVTMQKSK